MENDHSGHVRGYGQLKTYKSSDSGRSSFGALVRYSKIRGPENSGGK